MSSLTEEKKNAGRGNAFLDITFAKDLIEIMPETRDRLEFDFGLANKIKNCAIYFVIRIIEITDYIHRFQLPPASSCI